MRLKNNIASNMWTYIVFTIIFLTSAAQTQGSFGNDQEIFQKMKGLLSKSPTIQKKSADWLAAREDISLLPAFMDAMQLIRFPKEWKKPLRKISGKKMDADWPRWMEWLGRQDFTPHPVYQSYKFYLYNNIDPAIAAFFAADRRFQIRLDEVVWGGVAKDGIPALDNPPLLPAEKAFYLSDNDDVFGLALNGEFRAYPLRILNWHEMLNTTIGGEALSLTYCTLCGAAIAYFGKISDSLSVTFGSSGLLYRSNKLMYDRQTNSLWSSLTGEAVSGPAAEANMTLRPFYTVRTTWGEWRKRYPATKVLDVKTGHDRDYSPGAAYKTYFESDKTMFPVAWRDKRLQAKDWIYGIHINGRSLAYPLRALGKQSLINDAFNGKNLLVIAAAENMAVRVYARGEAEFLEKRSGNRLLDSEGNEWEIAEEHLRRSDGAITLPRLPGHLSFWFGWYAFFPESAVWQQP